MVIFLTSVVARIQAFDRDGAVATSINMLVKLGPETLKPNLRWHANCTALVVNHEIASMFKIMPNTVCQFSLAEILLMAAMNQVEAR